MCDMCKDFVSDPYPLSGGRIARIRWGQDAPSRSDLVVARGYILLPAYNSCSTYLLNSLQFGDRVIIMREALWHGWGNLLNSNDIPRPIFSLLQEENGWKFKFVEYRAPTWHEAMSSAWEHAHAELMKLEEALAQRKRALEEAECPDEMQIQQKHIRKIQVKGGE